MTRAGLVHIHGPIGNLCPGSQCLPAASAYSSSSSTALPSSAPQSPPSSSLSGITDLPPRPAVKILKRVPHASCEVAAKKLATVVGNVVNCNDHGSWVRLQRFPARCLRVPQRGGRRRNLASQVILQVSEKSDPPAQPPCKCPLKSNCSDDNLPPLRILLQRDTMQHWPLCEKNILLHIPSPSFLHARHHLMPHTSHLVRRTFSDRSCPSPMDQQGGQMG